MRVIKYPPVVSNRQNHFFYFSKLRHLLSEELKNSAQSISLRGLLTCPLQSPADSLPVRRHGPGCVQKLSHPGRPLGHSPRFQCRGPSQLQGKAG